MDIIDLGTPFGLAFASGLNAYLPLLAFAVSVRWLHLYKVNPSFAFITQSWFIVLLVILTILDFVADKIPLIDHTWDAIHTVIRPVAGALVAAAAGRHYVSGLHIAAVPDYHTSEMIVAASIVPIGGIGLLVVLLIGGVLAALSHTAKSTTRVLSTITTAGLFNIILSFGEDVLVVIAILLSLFVPAVMFILLVLFIVIFAPRVLRAWSKRINRRGLI